MIGIDLSKEQAPDADPKAMQQINPSQSGDDHFTPFWFSPNNSEVIKAENVAFYSIQYHFIKKILANFGIPNSL